MAKYFLDGETGNDAGDLSTIKQARRTFIGLDAVAVKVGDTLTVKGNPAWGKVSGTNEKGDPTWTTQAGVLQHHRLADDTWRTVLTVGDKTWEGTSVATGNQMQTTITKVTAKVVVK